MTKKKKILVIAHDAGGAEVIAAYVRRFTNRNIFHVYVAGPALKIFRRARVRIQGVADSECDLRKILAQHSDADFALLPLPGWMGTMERRALAEAKREGLRTIVYLDSWTEYRERYGYPHKGWKEKLPDQFWAGDRFAFALAKRLFPRPVRYVRNEYFETIRRTAHKRKKPVAILYVSNAKESATATLARVLEWMSRMPSPPPLIIRFHPAEQTDRFNALIKKYRNLRIITSEGRELAADLSRARVVIGSETVALAAAAIAGKRVINLVHKGAKSTLPLPQIFRRDSLARVKL